MILFLIFAIRSTGQHIIKWKRSGNWIRNRGLPVVHVGYVD